MDSTQRRLRHLKNQVDTIMRSIALGAYETQLAIRADLRNALQEEIRAALRDALQRKLGCIDHHRTLNPRRAGRRRPPRRKPFRWPTTKRP